MRLIAYVICWRRCLHAGMHSNRCDSSRPSDPHGPRTARGGTYVRLQGHVWQDSSYCCLRQDWQGVFYFAHVFGKHRNTERGTHVFGKHKHDKCCLLIGKDTTNWGPDRGDNPSKSSPSRRRCQAPLPLALRLAALPVVPPRWQGCSHRQRYSPTLPCWDCCWGVLPSGTYHCCIPTLVLLPMRRGPTHRLSRSTNDMDSEL